MRSSLSIAVLLACSCHGDDAGARLQLTCIFADNPNAKYVPATCLSAASVIDRVDGAELRMSDGSVCTVREVGHERGR